MLVFVVQTHASQPACRVIISTWLASLIVALDFSFILLPGCMPASAVLLLRLSLLGSKQQHTLCPRNQHLQIRSDLLAMLLSLILMDWQEILWEFCGCSCEGVCQNISLQCVFLVFHNTVMWNLPNWCADTYTYLFICCWWWSGFQSSILCNKVSSFSHWTFGAYTTKSYWTWNTYDQFFQLPLVALIPNCLTNFSNVKKVPCSEMQVSSTQVKKDWCVL